MSAPRCMWGSMPRRTRRPPSDVPASRPPAPAVPGGGLDPREWERACSAASALVSTGLQDEPWFLVARPVEVIGAGAGVELEVVVRWDSSEVRRKVPLETKGFLVEVVVEGQTAEVQFIH